MSDSHQIPTSSVGSADGPCSAGFQYNEAEILIHNRGWTLVEWHDGEKEFLRWPINIPLHPIPVGSTIGVMCKFAATSYAVVEILPDVEIISGPNDSTLAPEGPNKTMDTEKTPTALKVASSDLLCCTCRHWTRDVELMNHLQLNFSVGKCALGRSISHGITRGHDTCEQHNMNYKEGNSDNTHEKG